MSRRLLAAMLRPKQVSRIAQGCANLGCLDHAETTQSRSLEVLVGQSSWTEIQYGCIEMLKDWGTPVSSDLSSDGRDGVRQKLAYEALSFTIPWQPWQRQDLEGHWAKLHCHDCVSTTPPAVCDSPRTCYDALVATVKASDHINGTRSLSGSNFKEPMKIGMNIEMNRQSVRSSNQCKQRNSMKSWRSSSSEWRCTRRRKPTMRTQAGKWMSLRGERLCITRLMTTMVRGSRLVN